MTLISSIKFKPEILISAPRRSAATPNAEGTHALFTVSTYDLDAHTEYKETRILKVDDASSTLFSTDSKDSDAQWLGDTNLILYQRSTEGGETEIWIANGIGEKKAYFAGKIASSVTELKNTRLLNGNIGITFAAPTNAKGKIFNSKSAEKPKHTGKDFTKHPIRVWDTYNTEYRYSLYYTTLSRQPDGHWKLSKNSPINALKGTKIQYPLCPGAVLGETGSYAVGPRGIFLCTTDPGQNTALTLLFRAYLIGLNSFEEPHPEVIKLETTEEWKGAIVSPTFSAAGDLVAFVVARTEVAMKSERAIGWFPLAEISSSNRTVNLCKFTDGTTVTWDRWPDSLLWSHDSKALYVEAEDHGHVRLFKLDGGFLEGAASKTVGAPKLLTDKGSVSSVALLDRNNSDGTKLLITSTSFTEPSLYSILDTSTGKITPISSISNHGADLGLNPHQVESITFPGDKSDIQAFIVRPSFFDPKKQYPLLILVHGGPQSAWNDSWSTRWNSAVWAEQGYVVLMPNPSGSTGFGLELAASVCGDWGGRPYRDIVKAVDYVEANLKYVDTTNMVLGGGSYGGYMAFWIAGQPLAKRLKAIVSHDGVFTTASMYASDFISDLGHEVGSELWDDVRPWEKWTPAYYVKNWTTPMLVIHSELDYRCPISEGLGAYGALQAKGIPSRFLYFPDENHWVLKRENSLKWQNTVLGWFNHYAGIKTGVQLEDANCDAKFEEDDEEDDDQGQAEEK